MARQLNFYMDDSGTRHPDHKVGRRPAHGYDWFALGGILISEEDEDLAREMHAKFINKWDIAWPLHSSEIRARSNKFSFVGKLSRECQSNFYEELYQLLTRMPVLGVACVVDRDGYNIRYRDIYGDQRWLLCKSAFSISVERAAKYAFSRDRKLNIYPERSNKKDEAEIRKYFGDLKGVGMPFDGENSAKYKPATSDILCSTLYDLKFKDKSSPMVQIADLYLWPMCMGGYDPQNRPYVRLLNDGKIIDSQLQKDQIKEMAVKYYCFQ